ncbi:hypothetical protein [Sediminibacillus massiliensis]|uniref:hypothetical protein n=1 Tax=Sediminibacillus massiliensis TaxID=1926277 RepID=UPI0009887B73|nr:hypothetical protein [Sediminibacillus massiliensis]
MEKDEKDVKIMDKDGHIKNQVLFITNPSYEQIQASSKQQKEKFRTENRSAHEPNEGDTTNP